MNEAFRARAVWKWDPYIRKYIPYILPEGKLKCSLSEDKMDKIIACAGCGKTVKFGDAYTSLEINTDTGLGFSVCPRCYANEIERAKYAEKMRADWIRWRRGYRTK